MREPVIVAKYYMFLLQIQIKSGIKAKTLSSMITSYGLFFIVQDSINGLTSTRLLSL